MGLVLKDPPVVSTVSPSHWVFGGEQPTREQPGHCLSTRPAQPGAVSPFLPSF